MTNKTLKMSVIVNPFNTSIEFITMIMNENVTDAIINLIQNSADLSEMVNLHIPMLKHNFLTKYPYESLLWDEFDGSIGDFLNKLKIRILCDINDITIENLLNESPCNSIDKQILQNRELKFYIKMLLDTGMSVNIAAIYVEEYYMNPRAIKILLKIAKKYPQYVELNQKDESDFTYSLINSYVNKTEEEITSLFLDVDKLILMGVRPSEALDLISFYELDDVNKFLSYINNGFSSEFAFKLIIEGIEPSYEKMEQFLQFKTMFTEQVAIILVFTPFVINIPEDYVYTDDDVRRMNESFANEGPDFIYGFEL